MRDQIKYFGTSLCVHAGLLVTVLALAASAVEHSPPVSIDFTLENCPLVEQAAERPRQLPPPPHQQQPVTLPEQPVVTQPVSAQQAKPAPQQQAVAVPSPAAAPSPAPEAPVAAKAVSDLPRQIAAALPATVAAAPRTAAAGEERITPEKAQQRYLKEHFNYIRDLIIKRLAYPAIARRMEWSGRVILAFVVGEDGGIRSLRVRESSGYPVLDKSALETVAMAAPFPRPPVAAEIVMPVLFRLD